LLTCPQPKLSSRGTRLQINGNRPSAYSTATSPSCLLHSHPLHYHIISGGTHHPVPIRQVSVWEYANHLRRLAGNVADMSRHVGDDTMCRSNFGQMGPCCRHKIEDVVAVCVGSSRHLPDFPKCVCRNILWYGSTYAQKNRHNAHPTSTCKKRENTHYSFTIRYTPSSSTHASYKGYGCNNAKPPRPSHRNAMIDVVVLGCGPIWMGEGAAALFIGVHIRGEIRLMGGVLPWPNRDWRSKLDRLSRSKKSTIPQSTVRGLLMFGELAGGWNGGVATEIRGNIRCLTAYQLLAFMTVN